MGDHFASRSPHAEESQVKAIMLAAGDGIRCRPFSYLAPKIAQQVCGIPVLEYMLTWFLGAPEIEKLHLAVRQGVTIETINSYLRQRGHYSARFLDLFEAIGFDINMANPKLQVEAVGANGWGTAADLRSAINWIIARDDLGEDLLVCNADYVVTRRLPNGKLSPQLNLSDIIGYHRKVKKALGTVMTVSLVPVSQEEATRFGLAIVKDVSGYQIVRGFMEKPDLEDVPRTPLINAGVYVIDVSFLQPSLDEFLPSEQNINLEKTLLERLGNAQQSRLAGFTLDLDAWFHIGTLEQLINANLFIARVKG